MAMPERKHRLHMLLSEKEQGMLNDLADDREVNLSDCVRQLVKEAHALRVAPKKTRAKK